MSESLNSEYLLKETAKAGRDVRAKQKAYYSLPRDTAMKSAALKASKEAEKRFDSLITDLENRKII